MNPVSRVLEAAVRPWQSWAFCRRTQSHCRKGCGSAQRAAGTRDAWPCLGCFLDEITRELVATVRKTVPSQGAGLVCPLQA